MSGRKTVLFGVMCAVLVLGGCLSGPPGTPVVFDKNLPAEQTAHLFIHNGIEITAYNGIPVPTNKNSAQISGFKSEWHNIIIPSGETEFIMDIGVKWGFDIHDVNNFPFRFTFEPSADHVYILFFTPNGGADKDKRGITIYKQPPKETKFKNENWYGFVPIPGLSGTILQ